MLIDNLGYISLILSIIFFAASWFFSHSSNKALKDKLEGSHDSFLENLETSTDDMISELKGLSLDMRITMNEVKDCLEKKMDGMGTAIDAIAKKSGYKIQKNIKDKVKLFRIEATPKIDSNPLYFLRFQDS